MTDTITTDKSRWQPYPAYKPSGVEWLGDIPAHWENKRLRVFVESIQTGPFGSQLHSSDYVSGGCPIINPVHIQDGRIVADEDCSVDTATRDQLSRHILKSGDIIFGRRGEMGRCAVVTDDEQGWLCGTGSLRVRLRSQECSASFLYRALSTQGVREWLQLESVGSTMENLNATILSRIPLPSPTLQEQVAIAAFLDRETTRLDALIAKKQRLIELLQEQRAALISQAVTKGLDLNVAMKDSGIYSVGQIPAHWTVERNKWILREINDRSTTGEEELLTVSHITGVTPRSEKREVTMFLAESKEGYKRCRPDDLVINTMWAWMGALGITRHDGIVSPSYNVYRLSRKYIPKYLDLLYRTSAYICEIIRYSQGVWTSRLRLYPEEFFLMSTPTPPVPEQQAIVEYIEQETGRYNNFIAKLEESMDQLREYRTALISAAVTGKMDVREAVNGL